MKKALVGIIFIILAVGGAFAQEPEAEAPQDQNPAASPAAEAYYHFARAQALETTDWDAALEAYERALELDPTNSSIYSEIAGSYLRRGQVQEAIDYARRAVRADNDNLDAHRLLSSIYTNLLSNSRGQAVTVDMLDQAIGELEHIVRLDPLDREAYLMLGRLYRFKRDGPRAMEIYRDFLEIEPSSEEGAIALSELQIDAGNVDEAIDILTQFTMAQPDSLRAWTALGNAYDRIERYEPAAEAYARAVALDSEDVDLLRNLARTLFFSGQLDESAVRYEQVVAADPEQALDRLRLGQIYRQQMKFTEARVHLEGAAALVPDSAEIRFHLGLLNRDEGRFEDAVVEFQKLLDDTRKPNGGYTDGERANRRVFLTHLALIHSMQDQYDQAVQAFSEIKNVILDDDGTIDSYIVDTYRTADELDRAMEALDRALEEFPDNRALKVQRADLIAELGRVDEAIARLRSMLDGTDGDFDIYTAVFGIHERVLDYPAAQNVLDEMMERFPDREQTHFMQGALLEQQDKHEEAEAAFRRALEINADNPAVLNYLGYMLADNNENLDEALAMIQIAVEADPINGAYLDSLGWVYYRLNQLDLAEKFLKRALIFADHDATLHEHLGDLYQKTGRINEARSAYQRSLQRAEDPAERDRVQQKLDEL